MKINLNKNDEKSLDEILNQKDMNCSVSELNNRFLDESFDTIDEKGINELKKKEGTTNNDAMKEAFFQILGLSDDDPEIEEMEDKCSFGKIEELDSSFYQSYPFNNLPIKEISLGSYKLGYNYFEPYEIFNDEDTLGDEECNFSERTHLGYFTSKVKYLMLLQNNEIWMSITPHEIHTMKPYVKKAKGNVLTFGLGLGYYAYEVSNKEEVNSVTIIEKDNKVIQLFNKNILPLFPHKEKIRIIHEDAFLYYERDMKKEDYNTIFVDIYHTASDALSLYMRFKKNERKLTDIKVDYWIEESILCLLRRYILTLIEEYYQGYQEKDYLEPYDEESEILLSLFKKLKNMTFNNIDEIKCLLSNNGLISLLEE